jgi:hypothetical protein
MYAHMPNKSMQTIVFLAVLFEFMTTLIFFVVGN